MHMYLRDGTRVKVGVSVGVRANLNPNPNHNPLRVPFLYDTEYRGII